jgi:hypothetical protein
MEPRMALGNLCIDIGAFSYIDLYHTIEDGGSPSNHQSLPECILRRIIMHHGDLELYEGSKDHPECRADPGKCSNVGLDQIWRQHEPYVSREIHLDLLSV